MCESAVLTERPVGPATDRVVSLQRVHISGVTASEPNSSALVTSCLLFNVPEDGFEIHSYFISPYQLRSLCNVE
jgi:hypothetical protein